MKKEDYRNTIWVPWRVLGYQGIGGKGLRVRGGVHWSRVSGLGL